MQFLFLLNLFLILPFLCPGAEIWLRNVRQLTSSNMNFERAGQAHFSPDESSIIFEAILKGQKEYQIYTMNIKEGIPKLVSTGKGSCSSPSYHPGGQKILFASSHSDPKPHLKREIWTGCKPEIIHYMNIYEADLDGSNLNALTFGPGYHGECAYTPDGTKIIYISNDSGSMDFYMMDSDGSNVTQLTNNTDVYHSGRSFSADGSVLVFQADKRGNDLSQIHLLHIERQMEMQLTDNDAINLAPCWHPDGDKIIFASTLPGENQYEIYLLDLKHWDYHRITYNLGFDGLPVFSRNGKRLLWTSRRGADKSCQIYIADFKSPFEMNYE